MLDRLARNSWILSLSLPSKSQVVGTRVMITVVHFLFQLKLDEANDALESASRLNEQLEAKEEAINHLKNLGEAHDFNNDAKVLVYMRENFVLLNRKKGRATHNYFQHAIFLVIVTFITSSRENK